jgi:hypothetical protein
MFCHGDGLESLESDVGTVSNFKDLHLQIPSFIVITEKS